MTNDNFFFHVDLSDPSVCWHTYRVADFSNCAVNMPKVRQVIFNDEATVVYFEDDTRVIVRRSKLDEYNREHAIVYAIVKRAYGKVDPETGDVSGNGMSGMIQKILENAYDQGKFRAEQAQKKQAKEHRRPISIKEFMPGCECEDCSHCEESTCKNKPEIVKPWTTPLPKRDSRGRFVKKSNR